MNTTRIDEIATLAFNQRNLKPNKKELFNIVKDLINEGEKPDDRQLSRLYDFFTPSQPAKAKTSYDWLQKAVAVKDVREYLCLTYATETRICTTDGHRLHVAPLLPKSFFKPGYYDKNKRKIDVDFKYPDIDLVIPKASERVPFDLTDISKFNLKITSDFNGKPEEAIILVEDKTTPLAVNLRYLKAALSNPSHLVNAWIPNLNDETKKEKLKSIRLDFEDGSLAVVMPVRI